MSGNERWSPGRTDWTAVEWKSWAERAMVSGNAEQKAAGALCRQLEEYAQTGMGKMLSGVYALRLRDAIIDDVIRVARFGFEPGEGGVVRFKIGAPSGNPDHATTHTAVRSQGRWGSTLNMGGYRDATYDWSVICAHLERLDLMKFEVLDRGERTHDDEED